MLRLQRLWRHGTVLRRPGGLPGRFAGRALERLRTAGPVAEAHDAAQGGIQWPRLARGLLLGLPTLLAIVYFGFIAADRYVSEAVFVVRTAAKPLGTGGLGAVLQMTGLSRSQDDTFSVHDFITSRDAVRRLQAALPLADIYGRAEADAIARYPNLVYGASTEELHKYLLWMIDVTFNTNTGLSTLRVQAFRAEDAQAVAAALLDFSEQLVNEMNDRIQADTVRVNVEEVERNQRRLVEAQIAITRFRNQELMIDPAQSSVIVSELVAKLAAELAQVQTGISEMMQSSPSNPQLPGLRRRADVLAAQIARERTRISDSSDGLANKLAQYEALNMEREFAKQALTASETALETARLEARRQQLYLQRVVQPGVPDYPLMPDALRSIVTVFGINLVAVLVGWLILSGIREHAAAAQ